jgi:hypothetical protein
MGKEMDCKHKVVLEMGDRTTCMMCKAAVKFNQETGLHEVTDKPKPKRVRCGLCGRKMAQLAPHDRESYHYDCLANACGSMREHYRQAWDEWKRLANACGSMREHYRQAWDEWKLKHGVRS